MCNKYIFFYLVFASAVYVNKPDKESNVFNEGCNVFDKGCNIFNKGCDVVIFSNIYDISSDRNHINRWFSNLTYFWCSINVRYH